MKTVDRILQIVKRDGSVTAKQLSSELGMTTMGARQHLQGLEDEGILSTHDVKVKVGRPTRHWALTQKAMSSLPIVMVNSRFSSLKRSSISSVKKGLKKSLPNVKNSLYKTTAST